MKIRTRLGILALAVVITLGGFNLMVSPSTIELLKISKEAGYDIISNHLVENGMNGNYDVRERIQPLADCIGLDEHLCGC